MGRRMFQAGDLVFAPAEKFDPPATSIEEGIKRVRIGPRPDVIGLVTSASQNGIDPLGRHFDYQLCWVLAESGIAELSAMNLRLVSPVEGCLPVSGSQ